MAKKRYDLRQMFRRSRSKNVRDVDEFWSSDYSAIFEPNSKSLFGSHKVPKFKKRKLTSW